MKLLTRVILMLVGVCSGHGGFVQARPPGHQEACSDDLQGNL